jgi:two-component system nitrate/nitrite response regulator NarL
MSRDLTVVVVDDHPMLRSGVVETLSAADGIDVVGEGGSADDAVATVRATRPDVLVLDLGIPGGGLDAARRIVEAGLDTRIAVLTASEDEQQLEDALKLGVRAYMLKGVTGPELVDVVRRVAHGEVYVTPALAARMLIDRSVERDAMSPADAVALLTDRELEVLDLVAEAYSNKEIAARLEISEKTVKHHMTNIMGKLNARNRVEAAMMVRRHLSSSSR